MSFRTHRRTVITSIGAVFSGGLLVAALVALSALPALSVGATDGFTDPQGSFAFDIPDGWYQDATAANLGLVVQYTTANPDGAFSVTATPLPDGVSPDDAAQRVSAQLQQQYADYQQTNTGTATVAGEPGAELDYMATATGGPRLAVAQVLVAHGGTLYLLTVAARPEDASAIQQSAAPILASWRWLD